MNNKAGPRLTTSSSYQTMPSNIKLSKQGFASSLSFQNNSGFNSKSDENKRAHGYTIINSSETMQFFREKLLKISGNEKCADCGCLDAKWASINLGVFF